MARPRVFISSTFYDLRQVRADLERFIREMGYEPVLHERAHIAYGSEDKREEYAYCEIEMCDILIAIIGGRFGTDSQHEPYSISQMELKTALERGKQVYIFVERSVQSEYSTYLKNKDVKNLQFSFVDDAKVYNFLEEIYALPLNNTIIPFEVARDITEILKEQWAGLFQRYLQEQRRLGEVSLIEDLRTTTDTLNQLVTFLTKERGSQDEAIKSILLSTHPAFGRLRSLLSVGYRVFFTNHDEMAAWLQARSYRLCDPDQWDNADIEEWLWTGSKSMMYLHVSRTIFDEEGRLRIYTAEEWKDGLIFLEVIQIGDEPKEVTPSAPIPSPRRRPSRQVKDPTS